ncbi:hypothetical protein [Amycolatopsis sp. lyj-346]|uniref:hypothetical protein n=1 Tax=Amycolatopsis sp. lyj-346 TaxID=2789289 RepID=UPI00397A7AF5
MRSEIVVPLAIRDLTEADLPHCGWSGSRLHLEHVARELRRDDADYSSRARRGPGCPSAKD